MREGKKCAFLEKKLCLAVHLYGAHGLQPPSIIDTFFPFITWPDVNITYLND